MIGRIEAPTYAEWRKACDAFDAAFMAETAQADAAREARWLATALTPNDNGPPQ